MPQDQSNLPYKERTREKADAHVWYADMLKGDVPPVRYNQYPTSCTLGCRTGKHGTCPHGYRAYPAILQL